MKPHKTCKFTKNENIKRNKTYESKSMVWSTNVNSSQQGIQQLHLIIICEMLGIGRNKFIKKYYDHNYKMWKNYYPTKKTFVIQVRGW
jgi:hypothetical protein